jgi:hypothetical protein
MDAGTPSRLELALLRAAQAMETTLPTLVLSVRRLELEAADFRAEIRKSRDTMNDLAETSRTQWTFAREVLERNDVRMREYTMASIYASDVLRRTVAILLGQSDEEMPRRPPECAGPAFVTTPTPPRRAHKRSRSEARAELDAASPAPGPSSLPDSYTGLPHAPRPDPKAFDDVSAFQL